MHFWTQGELYLKWRSRPDEAPAAKFGRYLGRGDGEYSGADLAGSVVWDLFEEQGTDACDASLVGRITTEDGAVVSFEALGFFRRDNGAKTWTLASAVRFTSEATRYAHYDNLLGFMTGTFDMEAYEHHYMIYFPEPTKHLESTMSAAPTEAVQPS